MTSFINVKNNLNNIIFNNLWKFIKKSVKIRSVFLIRLIKHQTYSITFKKNITHVIYKIIKNHTIYFFHSYP